MCSGAILLYKIPRVVIGENTTFRGEESLLRERGTEVITLDNQECKDLMQMFISAHPDVCASSTEYYHHPINCASLGMGRRHRRRISQLNDLAPCFSSWTYQASTFGFHVHMLRNAAFRTTRFMFVFGRSCLRIFDSPFTSTSSSRSTVSEGPKSVTRIWMVVFYCDGMCVK